MLPLVEGPFLYLGSMVRLYAPYLRYARMLAGWWVLGVQAAGSDAGTHWQKHVATCKDSGMKYLREFAVEDQQQRQCCCLGMFLAIVAAHLQGPR